MTSLLSPALLNSEPAVCGARGQVTRSRSLASKRAATGGYNQNQYTSSNQVVKMCCEQQNKQEEGNNKLSRTNKVPEGFIMKERRMGPLVRTVNRAICSSTNLDHPGSTSRVLCRLPPNTAWPITLSPLAPYCQILLASHSPAPHRAVILIRGGNGNTTYIPVKVEPHVFLNVCKGVVTCFDLDCVNIEEICEELSPQHVTEAKPPKNVVSPTCGGTGEAIKASSIGSLRKDQRGTPEKSIVKKASKALTKPSRKDPPTQSLQDKSKPLLKREVQERLGKARGPNINCHRSVLICSDSMSALFGIVHFVLMDSTRADDTRTNFKD
uniref:Uncharacterized protein n=1 Tax=Timema tahoe TaxID=61484 RepID=A0A7R9IQZ0_9NEOP|nr:unnamed protein product [Timema tahoe]